MNRIARLRALRFRRCTWPFPAFELTNDLGDGWLICRLPRKENSR